MNLYKGPLATLTIGFRCAGATAARPNARAGHVCAGPGTV
ncbi:hypothetical protein MYA_5788 [Burkholderia sp. KJ006]|nr:hypothetical protein MYA_5788 [Burkholderia sp. KJ006]CAG9204360.1 conserved hypothetical protein [Burkholderia vietnamiensis]CAG9223112.1 conserved hypothetical protein [Burkholderia vietnamiensis]